MNRTPPRAVRQQLRQEVGFGCPVPDCGNPYLRWHHFDPPWRVREHHDPAGMIALCGEHHDKADAGTFTPEQLREWKATARDRNQAISGRFDWMRDQLLGVVGGNFYYETPIPLRVRDIPVVAFQRDAGGRLLLNLNMVSTSAERRMVIDENFWIETGDPTDLECPPHGRLVEARYGNGDELRVEFREVASVDELVARFPGARIVAEFAAGEPGVLAFPLAVIEIHLRVVAPDGSPIIDLGPTETRIAPGGITFAGNFLMANQVGLQLG